MNDPKWKGVFEQASSTNALQPPPQPGAMPAGTTNALPTPQTVDSIRGRIAAGTNFPFVVDQGGAGGKTTAQELDRFPTRTECYNHGSTRYSHSSSNAVFRTGRSAPVCSYSASGWDFATRPDSYYGATA